MEKQQLFTDSRKTWRAWLTKNHTTSNGVVLIFTKQSAGGTFTYDDMVEEALCFGWIDSTARRIDDTKTSLYFAPRKLKSNWSKPNKDRVEKLIKRKLMTPAGMKMIELAKQTGTWDALNDIDNLVIPTDLAHALKTHHPADTNFSAFPPSAQRMILQWILSAKRPETRVTRILTTAELAKANKRANQ